MVTGSSQWSRQRWPAHISWACARTDEERATGSSRKFNLLQILSFPFSLPISLSWLNWHAAYSFYCPVGSGLVLCCKKLRTLGSTKCGQGSIDYQISRFYCKELVFCLGLIRNPDKSQKCLSLEGRNLRRRHHQIRQPVRGRIQTCLTF